MNPRLFRPPTPRLNPDTVQRIQQMLEGIDPADADCKITISVKRQPEGGKPEKYSATVEVAGDFLEALLYQSDLAEVAGMVRPYPNGN